jgi:transcriptional regulator with XRE-family HTH domain
VAFGSSLKQARRRTGWKQDAFAEAFGVSRTTASNIERGLQRVFLDQVYRAAAILSVPVADLLPDPREISQDVVVRAAADDPISAKMARTLGSTLEALRKELLDSGTLERALPRKE